MEIFPNDFSSLRRFFYFYAFNGMARMDAELFFFRLVNADASFYVLDFFFLN